MMLGEDVDLHVSVNAVCCFGVFANTNASIADEAVELGEAGGEIFGYTVGLVEVLEVDLNCFNFAGVAEFGEAFLCFGEVLFFVAEEVEFGRVALEEVGTYAISDTCTATCNDVGLTTEVGDVLVRIEGVVAEHCGGCCDGFIAELYWLEIEQV